MVGGFMVPGHASQRLELLSLGLSERCSRRGWRMAGCWCLLGATRAHGVGAVPGPDARLLPVGAQVQCQRASDQYLAVDNVFLSEVGRDAADRPQSECR